MILFARLAADVSLQGKRIAPALLKDALLRSATAADTIGARAVLAVYAIASERADRHGPSAPHRAAQGLNPLRLELADVTDDGLLSRRPGKTTKPLLFEWTPELRAVVDRAKKLEPRVRRALLCTSKAKNPKRRPGQAYTEDGFNALWQRLMAKATKKDEHGNAVWPSASV